MKMYGTGQVARQLNLGRARLLALLDRGLVPEPPLRIDGRRLFTDDDVQRVRAALARRAGTGDSSRNSHTTEDENDRGN